MNSGSSPTRFFFRRAGVLVAVVAAGLLGARSASAACTNAPNVTSVTPDNGPVGGGTAVTINGTGFCSGNIHLFFGANRATSVVFVDTTHVTAVTPAGSAVGPVTVRYQLKGKQSRLNNGYTYTCSGCTVSPSSLQYEGVVTVQQTSEPNGVLEPGESSVEIQPTVIDSAGVTETNVTGAVTNITGPQNGASDITYSMNGSSATYGTITAGNTAQCSACYTATITIGGSGNRPTEVTGADADWDATMTEQPAVNGINTPNTIAWRVHVGNTFVDEPTSDIFYDYVERLVHNHVTFGTAINPNTFNPGDPAPRGQMAAFVARSFAGGDQNVPVSGTITAGENPTVNGAYDCESGGSSLFADVLPTDTFCKHIHYITGLNVTNGCDTNTPPDFCQLTNTTRAVMSVFISRALFPGLGDAGVPNAATGTGAFSGRTYDCLNGPPPFTDVTLDSPAGTNPSCKNIGYIWTQGIVDGNGDGTFSPSANVTRGQMSKFLDNAFALSIGPAQ